MCEINIMVFIFMNPEKKKTIKTNKDRVSYLNLARNDGPPSGLVQNNTMLGSKTPKTFFFP